MASSAGSSNNQVDPIGAAAATTTATNIAIVDCGLEEGNREPKTVDMPTEDTSRPERVDLLEISLFYAQSSQSEIKLPPNSERQLLKKGVLKQKKAIMGSSDRLTYLFNDMLVTTAEVPTPKNKKGKNQAKSLLS
jgi:hypothetical protein